MYVRRFFFLKSDELLKWFSEKLPPYKPDPEEVEAGYEKLAQAFGSFATIIEAAKELGVNPEVLLKWSAKEFYTTQLYLSHRAAVRAEFNRLIMAKK